MRWAYECWILEISWGDSTKELRIKSFLIHSFYHTINKLPMCIKFFCLLTQISSSLYLYYLSSP